MKAKTYRKPVFAGKDIPVIGMDQGKGRMYQGLGTHVCFNLFYDAALLTRAGQEINSSYLGAIQAGGLLTSLSFVQEGTNLWA